MRETDKKTDETERHVRDGKRETDMREIDMREAYERIERARQMKERWMRETDQRGTRERQTHERDRSERWTREMGASAFWSPLHSLEISYDMSTRCVPIVICTKHFYTDGNNTCLACPIGKKREMLPFKTLHNFQSNQIE